MLGIIRILKFCNDFIFSSSSIKTNICKGTTIDTHVGRPESDLSAATQTIQATMAEYLFKERAKLL